MEFYKYIEQHDNKINRNCSNEQADVSRLTVGTGGQNSDCPVWQQGWPEGENNEGIVLRISDCGQTDLAGIIWILYGAIPSHSGLFVFWGGVIRCINLNTI